MDEWQPGACERCGAEGEVRRVGYVVHDEQHSQLLCADCKELTLVRTRVRVVDPTAPPPSLAMSLSGWLVLAAGLLVLILAFYGFATR